MFRAWISLHPKYNAVFIQLIHLNAPFSRIISYWSVNEGIKLLDGHQLNQLQISGRELGALTQIVPTIKVLAVIDQECASSTLSSVSLNKEAH